MTLQPMLDLRTPIGEILTAAGSEGIVLESEGQKPCGVIPLDDDLLDQVGLGFVEGGTE